MLLKTARVFILTELFLLLLSEEIFKHIPPIVLDDFQDSAETQTTTAQVGEFARLECRAPAHFGAYPKFSLVLPLFTTFYQ